MKYTLILLLIGFFGTPFMVVYMNNRSGVTYEAIQERLRKEDQAFQSQMVRIEIKEESVPTTDFPADMHLTTK